jgi:hypothetical protein
MRKIYGIGCMQLDLENEYKPIKNLDLQGLYTSFEEAEAAVLSNRGDMVEYYYNMIIIESMYLYGEGDDKYDRRETHWYKVDYTGPILNVFGHEPVISKTIHPEIFKSTCHFLGC